jgi:hypothetical protein
MMEMSGGGDVLGITGLGACRKTVHIIDKMGNYHSDALRGRPVTGDERVVGTYGAQLFDSGSTPVQTVEYNYQGEWTPKSPGDETIFVGDIVVIASSNKVV